MTEHRQSYFHCSITEADQSISVVEVVVPHVGLVRPGGVSGAVHLRGQLVGAEQMMLGTTDPLLALRASRFFHSPSALPNRIDVAWKIIGKALIARFMGPIWDTPGAHRTQVGPMGL